MRQKLKVTKVTRLTRRTDRVVAKGKKKFWGDYGKVHFIAERGAYKLGDKFEVPCPNGRK